jgi:phosphoesterase RecJ-like protein
MIDSFKALSLGQIADELPKIKNTLILFHVRPDADAVGSAFALRELLRVMGVPVWCACADEIPARLEFLVDGVQGSVLLEDELVIDYERIIAVDSASPEQLGSLFGRLRRDVDIMIDHHARGRIYADHYIDTSASATGEIIYRIAELLLSRGAIDEIPERVKNCIYAAISADTGSFRYSNATPTAMRIAAELVENGVDHAAICSALYDSKPLGQLVAESEAVRDVRLYEDGRVATLLFTYELREKLGVTAEELDTLIDVLRSIEGVEVAIVIKQPEPTDSYRVSLRSKNDVDVAAVSARFGGGGHARAAGCTVVAQSAEAAEKKVLEALNFYIKF